MEIYEYHLREAKSLCSKQNCKPEKAAIQLGIAHHPYQDWVAHGDHGMYEGIAVTIIHNSLSPQYDFGWPGLYPDNPLLDAKGSADGRPTKSVLIMIGTHMGAQYTDYAVYEKGSKRFNLTKTMTIESLKEFYSWILQNGCCKCLGYFAGVINAK